MKQVLFILFLVFVFSCSNKNKLKQDLAQLQSREISIPLDKMQHQVNGIDTLITDFADSELKLVIYSDSSACSSCAIQKIHLWDSFIEDAEKYQGRLKFYFLFSPAENDLITANLALRTNRFNYPVFIDSDGVFAKQNPHLPKNPNYILFY